MSASTERKNRAAAREAGTDKKMLAQQEAEKKAAKSRRRWTIGSILVAILLIVIILLNSGFLYKHTAALSVGGRNYSPAELSYSYVGQYTSFLNNYGSYASLFGLDTSQGVASLSQQSCPMLEEGKTWRDYFLQNAENSLLQVTALKNYADQNGISLDEADLAALDEDLAALDEAARSYGYASANRFLAAQYGTGVNTRLVRSMTAESTLASKVLQAYSDSLDYSDEELEEYYASLEGSSDLFDYAVYTVAAETVPAEGEGEDAQAAPTEQTLLEARMTAEAIEMAYRDGYDIDDPVERLDAAIEAEYDAGSATVRSSVSGGSLGDLSDWLRDSARKNGDISVIESSDGTGYHVAVFLSRNDNHYPTVSVRHILIKAAASEDGSFSDKAKQVALDRINEIKAEFEAGDRSEESFAALAEKYSEDAGSNTNGGLYENIYQGQMVEEFNDFCFSGHKSGDVGVVYGENGGYAGYHLVYFVGEGDLYSNTIARSALTNTAMSDFLAAQTEGLEPVLRYWAKLVG
ncbi:MAG: peptidylprolyl isomerase [Oscillospiraceae bacterium]|nr:peptidylprolyl isomerase [Oscillospiraceae bacterium]